MNICIEKRLIVVLLLFLALASTAKDKVKVACVGNSVTFGYGLNKRVIQLYCNVYSARTMTLETSDIRVQRC